MAVYLCLNEQWWCCFDLFFTTYKNLSYVITHSGYVCYIFAIFGHVYEVVNLTLCLFLKNLTFYVVTVFEYLARISESLLSQENEKP